MIRNQNNRYTYFICKECILNLTYQIKSNLYKYSFLFLFRLLGLNIYIKTIQLFHYDKIPTMKVLLEIKWIFVDKCTSVITDSIVISWEKISLPLLHSLILDTKVLQFTTMLNNFCHNDFICHKMQAIFILVTYANAFYDEYIFLSHHRIILFYICWTSMSDE